MRHGVMDNIITFNYITYPHIPLRTYIPQDIILPVYMYLLYLLDGIATVWMKSSVFIHLMQLPSNPILFGFGWLALRCDFSKTKIQPLTHSVFAKFSKVESYHAHGQHHPLVCL